MGQSASQPVQPPANQPSQPSKPAAPKPQTLPSPSPPPIPPKPVPVPPPKELVVAGKYPVATDLIKQLEASGLVKDAVAAAFLHTYKKLPISMLQLMTADKMRQESKAYVETHNQPIEETIRPLVNFTPAQIDQIVAPQVRSSAPTLKPVNFQKSKPLPRMPPKPKLDKLDTLDALSSSSHEQFFDQCQKLIALVKQRRDIKSRQFWDAQDKSELSQLLSRTNASISEKSAECKDRLQKLAAELQTRSADLKTLSHIVDAQFLAAMQSKIDDCKDLIEAYEKTQQDLKDLQGHESS